MKRPLLLSPTGWEILPRLDEKEKEYFDSHTIWRDHTGYGISPYRDWSGRPTGPTWPTEGDAMVVLRESAMIHAYLAVVVYPGTPIPDTRSGVDLELKDFHPLSEKNWWLRRCVTVHDIVTLAMRYHVISEDEEESYRVGGTDEGEPDSNRGVARWGTREIIREILAKEKRRADMGR